MPALRKTAYYANVKGKHSLGFMYWNWRYRNKGIRLGFSIGYNAVGYACVIPHYGTIVVNNGARLGNFCVLQTSTCIAGGDKTIGDGFYLATGSQVVGPLTIGDNVTLAAHSLLNKSFGSNLLLVGAPATVKRTGEKPWYAGQVYEERIAKIKQLRKEMFGES